MNPAERRDRFHQRSRCSSLARQANSLQSTIVEGGLCRVREDWIFDSVVVNFSIGSL